MYLLIDEHLIREIPACVTRAEYAKYSIKVGRDGAMQKIPRGAQHSSHHFYWPNLHKSSAITLAKLPIATI